jgi:hypothetical protein
MGKSKNNSQVPVLRPKTQSEFNKLNRQLNAERFVAIDLLKSGRVRDVSLAMGDPATTEAADMAGAMGCGAWSNGPLAQVAWAFDERDNTVTDVFDKDGKTALGLGYVKWGPNNATPSVIPPLAQSSPYTAAPLAYLADLTTGLGPSLMYRFPDGTLDDFRDAGYKILQQLEKKKEEDNDIVLPGVSVGVGDDKHTPLMGDFVMTELGVMSLKESELLMQELPEEEKWLAEPQGVSSMPRSLGPDYWNKLYMEWERTWYGYDETDDLGKSHIPGAREFLEENNLSLHIAQCMQDDVMLDIYFPTVGFSNRGRKGLWNPVINRVGFLPAHSTRLEKMDDNRFIHHCYFSDSFRTLGAKKAQVVSPEAMKITMYQAAMPQQLLHELRYIVTSNQKSAAYKRPMWVVCPTFFPSLNKPYYPQPAWWSVFTSKAFDFSATILYDKYKQRENSTTWSRILYISLDYLEMVFSDEGIAGDKDAQQKYIDELDDSVEQFLQRRENNGKMMRQFMWTDQKGDEHFNVKIVDVADAKQDAIKAGKEELELSTSPQFLALRVDPRLVGVPMVAASNGGTALREMALLKQQQLNPKQRLYEHFLNSVARFNGWSERAEFHIKQISYTTLDRSKTGTVETISGEGA